MSLYLLLYSDIWVSGRTMEDSHYLCLCVCVICLLWAHQCVCNTAAAVNQKTLWNSVLWWHESAKTAGDKSESIFNTEQAQCGNCTQQFSTDRHLLYLYVSYRFVSVNIFWCVNLLCHRALCAEFAALFDSANALPTRQPVCQVPTRRERQGESKNRGREEVKEGAGGKL